MPLALIQPGTGGALCVYAAPSPDVRPGAPDAPIAPKVPRATLVALGPAPCVVSVNATGAETPGEIMAFARQQTGRPELWWAALIGASRGCDRVRDLYLAGANALALVLANGMQGQSPPTPVEVGFAESIVALARAGVIVTILLHTYLDAGSNVTSTVTMARRATGWALASPPDGEMVRRVQAPEGGASADPSAWRGQLVVYSQGSSAADKAAHHEIIQVALPVALRDFVRPLVDLRDPPVVSVARWSVTSPEPHPHEATSRNPTLVSTLASEEVGAPATPTGASSPRAVSASVPEPLPTARVLLIGDSFAEGLGAPLAELAAAVGLPFKGLGVRSSTIRQWLSGTALVDAMTAADPTLTLVSLGANDMGASDAVAEGRRAGQLIDALRRNGSAAVAWIASPRMPHESSTFRTQLAAECAQRDVRVFDSPALSLERAPHDFHMTPKGYRAWAEAIAAWIPFAGLASGAVPPDPSPRASAGSAPAKAPPKSAPAPGAAPRRGQTPNPDLGCKLLPAPHPRSPGEGRTAVDATAPLGARAAQFSYEEERDGVREDPPGSNRGPRIDQYRRGLGTPGDPWCAFGFCFAAYAVLQPGETLPHAYTGSVAEIVRTGKFHPRGDGYQARVGDGATWKRNGQDPTRGGQGHIGRVFVVPDAAGRFESIEANAGDGWAQREHHVDEEGFLGWVEYPSSTQNGTTAVRAPDAIVVEGMGELSMEEYVARVVTGEIGATREPQALAALAMAARSYAVWMMHHETLGTTERPMSNSTRKQVVARAATQRATDAARATREGLILHRGRVVLASHVAGAIWPPGASHGRLGRDDTKTEKYVTYNDGLVGTSVHRSPIAGMKQEDNRGCLSQNGAIALAQRGFVWPEILRYFYGRDLEFTCAEPASRLGPRTPRTSPTLSNAAALSASGDESLVLLAVGLAVSRALG